MAVVQLLAQSSSGASARQAAEQADEAGGRLSAPAAYRQGVSLLNGTANWLTQNLARRTASRILDMSPLLEAPVTAKDTVRALLDRLPNDCSLDDVQYHLYVVQAVNRGLSDGEAGRTIPHEQVAADLRRKWLLGSAT